MEPLTRLSDEEELFQSTVGQFARERLTPHVRQMDETGVFRKDLLGELFDLGLMAVDVPEDYGGQGGSFFQTILAIEELAKVDPSASVIVDVHNTLCNSALQRWGTEEQKRRYLPRRAPLRTTVISGSPDANYGSPTQPRPACSWSSPMPTRPRAIAASLLFWWSAEHRDSRWERRRTSSAYARRPPVK